jgi:protease-4
MNLWSKPQHILLNDRQLLVSIVVCVAGIGGLALGWHKSGAALILAGTTALALHVGWVIRPVIIRDASVLVIRLVGELRELESAPLIQQIFGRFFPSLRQVLAALDFCSRDPKVKTVLVEITGLGVGFATAQELGELLRVLHERGKRVIALLNGDAIGLREYMVAAGAGEIVANPNLSLTMVGLAAGGPFLKRALDKLQIETQTLQWKEYKGAAETFVRDKMSPALRESTESLINDWEKILVARVSAWRGISAEQVRELLNSGFLSTDAALGAGLVDRLGYFEDLQDQLDPGGKGKVFVSLFRYLWRVGYLSRIRRARRIALIYGVGPVITGDTVAGEFISGNEMAQMLQRASMDQRIAAIVMRINSPGGSAVGSDLVWRAVNQARQRNKPVVVSMGDVAASGGYYIASGADAIVAGHGTISGSIGVMYAKFNLGALLERIGVNFDFVKTTEASDALSPARALSPSELEQLDQLMGNLYRNFTAKVAQGRHLSDAKTEEVAKGRIWSGLAAHGHGLVDDLGGFQRAIEIAREKAGLAIGEPHELVLFHPPSRYLRTGLRLPRRFNARQSADLLFRTLQGWGAWAPALVKLASAHVPLLLCPFF